MAYWVKWMHSLKNRAPKLFRSDLKMLLKIIYTWMPTSTVSTSITTSFDGAATAMNNWW